MGVILSLLILLFSVVVHEVAHAWQARREGDHTAEQLGRITLNPLKHIDPVGSVALPLLLFWSGVPFMFGWAKPVPVNPIYYRNYRAGDIRVSLAGIVSNLGLAVLFTLGTAAILGFTQLRENSLLVETLWGGIYLNLALAIFNLIPIPPLDGSHVLAQLLPSWMADKYERVGRFGFVAVIALMVLPGARNRLFDAVLIPMRAVDWFIHLWT